MGAAKLVLNFMDVRYGFVRGGGVYVRLSVRRIDGCQRVGAQQGRLEGTPSNKRDHVAQRLMLWIIRVGAKKVFVPQPFVRDAGVTESTFNRHDRVTFACELLLDRVYVQRLETMSETFYAVLIFPQVENAGLMRDLVRYDASEHVPPIQKNYAIGCPRQEIVVEFRLSLEWKTVLMPYVLKSVVAAPQPSYFPFQGRQIRNALANVSTPIRIERFHGALDAEVTVKGLR